jgi:phytoene dehydrogenase-like protein
MAASNGSRSKYDVIVIGGGHNGLVNSAYLARAGKKVLVLERRHVLGGAAVTEEIFPGFKFSGSPAPWTGNPSARWDFHANAKRRLLVASE